MFKTQPTKMTRTLAKVATTASTAMLSLALLSACSPKKADESVNTTAETSTESKAPVVDEAKTVAAKAIVDQVMGTMASAFHMANTIAKEKNDGKPQFTTEQIECFVTKDNDLAITKMQEYINSVFSTEELNELNDFYSSSAGEKQVNMSKQLIDGMMSSMSGQSEFDIMAMQQAFMDSLSEEEKQKIEAFSQSPTAQKLQESLNDQEKLEPFIKPFITAKEQHCQMPVNQ